jgi:hypothetical protein
MQRSVGTLLAIWLLLGGAGTAAAQNWARQLFEDTSHNFGTVARAARAVHVFEFTNTLSQSVHIRGVRTSCGCATPVAEKSTVASGEQGAIRATFNTRSYVGRRSATITVVFDQPSYAEVQLQVRGYVRRDIVFRPGGVDFGSVHEGTAVERVIDLQYAGRSDWRITEIRSPLPYLTAEAEQTRRGYGRVGYQLVVRLSDDAPSGYLDTELTLHTDDPRLSRVPLGVQGQVAPLVSVSPALLFLGHVKTGEQVKSRLVVRGPQPFRITEVQCDDERFRFDVGSEKKTLHFIPVVFLATGAAGNVSEKICVHTDLPGDRAVELIASGTIAP